MGFYFTKSTFKKIITQLLCQLFLFIGLNPAGCNSAFGASVNNFLISCLPLFCSFPDVMMPSYSKNRWSCVFFIVYLSIELYFIMNLVLLGLLETVLLCAQHGKPAQNEAMSY